MTLMMMHPLRLEILMHPLTLPVRTVVMTSPMMMMMTVVSHQVMSQMM